MSLLGRVLYFFACVASTAQITAGAAVVASGSGIAQHVLFSSSDSVGKDVQDPYHSDGPRRRGKRMTGFVAFGDSYSAGIGTLVNGTENECRQGTGAYPALIAADLAAASHHHHHHHHNGTNNDNNNTATADPFFQWLSCTGSTTEQLLSGNPNSQIDAFNMSTIDDDSDLPTADFATLSIGGNDLGFFDVMNACVFRFYSFYSGTCATALAASDAQIRSPAFELRLTLVMLEILDKARWERRPWFTITVTGYARFFDAETAQCDDASLGVWWGGPKLTRQTRRRMNELVLAVNDKLRRTVEEVNRRFATEAKVLFADYDGAFEGHRFCEEGVREPDYGREDTWFFLPGGGDNVRKESGNGTAVAAAVLPPSSPLVDPAGCLEAAERSGDWGEKALCYMAMAKQRDPTLRPSSDRIMASGGMWYVPTYYGKTFHPRSRGHEVMRNQVYKGWDEHHSQKVSSTFFFASFFATTRLWLFVFTTSHTGKMSAMASDIAFPQDAQDTISSLRWSPVSNHLAAASWDGKVYIYDATNASSIKGIAMITTEGPVFDCDFKKDGTLVAAAGADKKVHVLDAASGKTMTLAGHEAPIRNVRFVNIPQAQDSIIATGSWDKTVRYWDLRQDKPVATLNCDERVYAMDAGGTRLVVALANNKVHLVDLSSNPVAFADTVQSPLTHQTRSVSVTTDGARWAIGSIEGRAGLQAAADTTVTNFTWRCHREAHTSTSRNSVAKVWAVNDVSFLPTDKDVLATAGSDGTFSFWDIKAKTKLKSFPDVGGSITAAAFSYDGSAYAYAVGYDWSKGYSHNSPTVPTKIVVHSVTKEEVSKKKKR
ncbi:WD40-repeat-containing domain protein [Bombardia bombarda]|uniref:WD40-repeat-containing domain protein n=1 Tax=Bombardia bombarda TaxID=252184 RepID=A0AA39XBK9_9PEZI|nr:WD40-repeat-containing domain protein [Bombardia bombarda]